MNRNSKNQYISSTVKEHSFQKRSVIQWNPISISYLNNCKNKKGSINWRCFLECLLSSLVAASAAVLPKYSSRQPQASHRTSCKHHPHLPETPAKRHLPGEANARPKSPAYKAASTNKHHSPLLCLFLYFSYPSSGILWNKTKPKRNTK